MAIIVVCDKTGSYSIQNTPLAGNEMADAIYDGKWNPPQNVQIESPYLILNRGELTFLTNQDPPLVDLGATLSRQELCVLRYVANGDSLQQVACKLHIAIRTVRKHLDNAKMKLKAKSRDHLMAIAGSLGLVKSTVPTDDPPAG